MTDSATSWTPPTAFAASGTAAADSTVPVRSRTTEPVRPTVPAATGATSPASSATPYANGRMSPVTPYASVVALPPTPSTTGWTDRMCRPYCPTVSSTGRTATGTTPPTVVPTR
ncbi:hypothetical protein ABZ825_09085 [Streptomyces tauricus]|uniref:hypothetical protein n=1 Tax=Streptomyces tauricus TaxID=68274 RepID=UPI0033D1D4CB